MPKPIELTESERNTLTNALHVAAERFGEHVHELRRTKANCGTKVPPTGAELRLADQFERQRLDTHSLRDRIENAVVVMIQEGQ